LKRDAGEFLLKSGTVYLYSEVAGMSTGAVFVGEGTLHVVPPDAMERKQLKAVMKTEVLDQRFTTAVFAFTDGTAAELKKGAGASATSTANAMGPAQDAQDLFRKVLRYDLEARLLEDAGTPNTGGFFLAEVKGPLFSKRLIYVIDPHGAIAVEPEEVALLTSSDEGFDVTLGFQSAGQRRMAVPTRNEAFRIPQQTIDATIDKNGRLTAIAVTQIEAKQGGVAVLPLQMFPTLRVSGVWGPNGEALDFIQEDKNRDAGFAIVLKKPLAKGEISRVTTKYSGADAVIDEGNGNYFLVARESWYPNMRGTFGNYAFYTMTFHTPKSVQVVGTGDRVKEDEDGKVRTSVWQSLTPMPVAGFNLGEFQSEISERNKDVQVVSYANKELADRYNGIANSGMAVGNLNTVGMLKRATSEGDAAMQIYADYFGPLPYDHVSLTQQTACNYGQSWPTLVYLPICYFWDSTIQNQIGVLSGDPTYWKVVTAHEVAHQWWGQTVGFGNYRDQWMSEGFANFSAAVFLMRTNKDMKEYRDFYSLLRKRLLQKNELGLRPVDVGSVVMGTRVNTSRTGGGVYQSLIYNKGAFILHMLEMLYWTPEYQNGPFKEAMHDFVKTYTNRAATTEDFKAVMERHLPPWADATKDHKLDWFFNAYVYGTEIPKYTITSNFTKEGDEVTAHFAVTQNGVSDDFLMLVPIYLEYDSKRYSFFGRAMMKGNKTVEQTIKLGKMKDTPKGMVVAHNYDLLSD
jgi:hypothetical protein